MGDTIRHRGKLKLVSEAVADELIYQAISHGDLAAVREIYDRLDGRPIQATELTATISTEELSARDSLAAKLQILTEAAQAALPANATPVSPTTIKVARVEDHSEEILEALREDGRAA